MKLDKFYENVKVGLDESTPLGRRLKQLLDNVISRLPEEEQFTMAGFIVFETRNNAIKFWQYMSAKDPRFRGYTPDFSRKNRDGTCIYSIGEDLESSGLYITIIVDALPFRSDDYIRGLIVHELSEMSAMYNIVKKELPDLLKMSDKAKKVRLAQIGKGSAPPGSTEHEQHEREVNNEAIRLGFANEINALEGLS